MKESEERDAILLEFLTAYYHEFALSYNDSRIRLKGSASTLVGPDVERAVELLKESLRLADKSDLTANASEATLMGPDADKAIERLNESLRLADKLDLTEAVAAPRSSRPPFNAEYLLFLFLRRDERDAVMGDLLECYAKLVCRFSKRRADIWFYKQVAGSLFPLVRQALLRIGALVWLGRILRRLIS